ncbi:MAG: DUF3579 domain-containing protein [Burkholderiaceae bacterium]
MSPIEYPFWIDHSYRLAHCATSRASPPKQYFIEGVTNFGRVFRLSDWALRYC